MIARYHRHRIASAIYEVTLSAQVTITHQRNPFFIPMAGPKLRSRSPVSSVLQLIGSFLIVYCPYYIVILWNSSVAALYNGNIPKSLQIHKYYLVTAATLLVCSSFVNGLLYGVKSKIMRKTFQNYVRKKKTKSEISQEIQARTPSTCGSRRPSLTTLGVFNRPIPQRRLSETVLDHNRPLMKRIASETSWRPSSLTFANGQNGTMEVNVDDGHHPTLSHTSSCNTLQIPSQIVHEFVTETDQIIYENLKDSYRSSKINKSNPRNIPTIRNPQHQRHHQQQPSPIPLRSNHSKSSISIATTTLLQKVLRVDLKDDHINCIDSMTNIKSPRILITRAYSEDSQPPSSPLLTNSVPPIKQLNNGKHSNEKQTYVFVPKDSTKKSTKFAAEIDSDDDDEECSKLSAVESESRSTSASNSTTLSSVSARRFSSLDDQSTTTYTTCATTVGSCDLDSAATTDEHHMLLSSWPITRKKLTVQNMHHKINQSKNNTQFPIAQFSIPLSALHIPDKKILKPLYTDRCEKPDVAL